MCKNGIIVPPLSSDQRDLKSTVPGTDWPLIHVSFTVPKITNLIWDQIQSSENLF